MKNNETLFQIKKEECVERVSLHSFSVGENPCDSLWKKTSVTSKDSYKKSEELEGQVDVVIIGGGMAGILTAYQLKQRGIHAIVLERGEVGRTCTANTTAKITSLHGAVYRKIAHAYGKERARKYYDLQQKSIKNYEKIMIDCNLSCDFEQKTHIMYATTDEQKLQKEFESLNEMKIPCQWVEHAPLPFDIIGGIAFLHQAQFHPLKFIDGIIEELNVFPHCQVTRIDSNGLVEVNFKQKIQAKQIVIATHYPIINSKGFYFVRLDQERSYVAALEQVGGFDIHDMYIDIKKSGHSFRMYQDKLIMGLGNHRSGKKKLPNYYQELEAESMKWFPKSRIQAHWSNQDCMSLDHLPYIGKYSKALGNIFVATGFNQWGMSNSMAAANVISDMIATDHSEYEDVVNPRRHQLSGTGTFLINGAISAVHLTKQLLHMKADELSQIKNGDAGIIKMDGETIGVYKNDSGKLYAVDTRCPHLGCQLEWNPIELTWDCPCHGSRFDIEGKLIEDPAQKDLAKAKCQDELTKQA